MRDYSEDDAMASYIWSHHPKLLTQFESRVHILWTQRMKSHRDPSRPAPDEEEAGYARDARIEAALADYAGFRRAVTDRILRKHGQKIFVNRCPNCSRVVRTPTAKQCFWCGHDWH